MNLTSSISTSATSSSAAAALRLLSSSSSSKTLITPFYSRTRHSSSIPNFASKNSMSNNNNKNISPSPICAAAAFSAAATSAPERQPDKPTPQPWLIVGLGNPGKRYASTRHNVGFEMVDYIAEAEGISMGSLSFKALFGKGHIGNVAVMLAKPQTFMNSSGDSLRLLPKGGHGGHNGMKSIINHFKGSRDFPRLRIGIGRPPGKMDPVNFVMRPFNKQEREELDFTFQTGLEAVRILLLEGINKSATFVNSAKSLEKIQ